MPIDLNGGHGWDLDNGHALVPYATLDRGDFNRIVRNVVELPVEGGATQWVCSSAMRQRQDLYVAIVSEELQDL